MKLFFIYMSALIVAYIINTLLAVLILLGVDIICGTSLLTINHACAGGFIITMLHLVMKGG